MVVRMKTSLYRYLLSSWSVLLFIWRNIREIVLEIIRRTQSMS